MLNILVVDDIDIIRHQIAHALQGLHLGESVRILQASSGQEAIELLLHHEIDIFFLDIDLGDLSGLQVAEKIRSIRKYLLTPIVFITGHSQYMLEGFKTYHCYDFLQKPFSSQKVTDITKTLIRSIQQKEYKKNLQKAQDRLFTNF